MKARNLTGLLTVFIVLFIIVFQVGAADTIGGKKAEEILKTQFPSAYVAHINWADRFMPVSSWQVWDTLTGNPFSGNEPYTKQYVRGVYGCKDFANDSVALIRKRIPNAAVFTVTLLRRKKKIIGPLWIGDKKGHVMICHITPEGKIQLFEPQNPNLHVEMAFFDRPALFINY